MPMGWLPGEQKIQHSPFAAGSFLVDGKSTSAVFRQPANHLTNGLLNQPDIVVFGMLQMGYSPEQLILIGHVFYGVAEIIRIESRQKVPRIKPKQDVDSHRQKKRVMASIN
jgi:hypothetical protein